MFTPKVTNQAVLNQSLSGSSTLQALSTAPCSETRNQFSLDIPQVRHGIDPPTYLQTIQQKPVPPENQYPLPSEPPPEYTGPSPGYDGKGHLATAEEQERNNAVADELGRLTILLDSFCL